MTRNNTLKVPHAHWKRGQGADLIMEHGQLYRLCIGHTGTVLSQLSKKGVWISTNAKRGRREGSAGDQARW